MGFRFRKTLSLLPGVRLNFSKSGPSLSLGKQGATVNLSPKGARGTLGLPGSGMSWSEYMPWSKVGDALGGGDEREAPRTRSGMETPALAPAEDPFDPRAEALRDADRELAKALAAKRAESEALHRRDITEQWRQLQPLPSLPAPSDGGANAGDVISAALEALDFPFETKCTVALADRDEAFVLLDLPEIEDVIPEERVVPSKSGGPKNKRRTKRERGRDYAHLTCGLALLMGRTAIAAAPSLERVHIAAYTQRRRPKSGVLDDDFVYEVALHRDQLSGIELGSVDPIEVVHDAPSRIDLRDNGELKRIDPPAWAGDLAGP